MQYIEFLFQFSIILLKGHLELDSSFFQIQASELLFFTINSKTLKEPKFSKEEKISSAQKGTLIHMCLQKLDEKKEYNYETVEQLIKSQQAHRIITEKEAEAININAIFEDEYGLDEFCKNVIDDLENRCRNYCYKVRLEQTAKYAKENRL